MNWNIVLGVVVVVALGGIAVWLALEVRRLTEAHDWEFGTNCPLAPKPGAAVPGETQWDRLIREVGDPADISTSGSEFAMPEAK